MNNVFIFLKQIRFVNLLMLVLVQFITNYVFVNSVTNFHLALISLSTILIAAGGYIINDIYDFEIDKVNKPDVVINKPSLNIYYALSSLGLFISFYLSYISDIRLFALFVFAFSSLFLYAKYLSKYKLIGNILISLLIVEAIIIVPLFKEFDTRTISFVIVLFYSLFAFFLNWAREIIKDLEDQKGDKAFGRKTLPILIGEFNSKLIVVCLVLITTLMLLPTLDIQPNYLLVPICIGFLFIIFMTMTARNKQDFKRVSLLLKLVMFYGLISPLFL